MEADPKDTTTKDSMTPEPEIEDVFVVIKEEEVPVQISQDAGDIESNVKAEKEVLAMNEEEESLLEISPEIGEIIERNVKTEDEEENVRNMEEGKRLRISPGTRRARYSGNYAPYKPIRISLVGPRKRPRMSEGKSPRHPLKVQKVGRPASGKKSLRRPEESDSGESDIAEVAQQRQYANSGMSLEMHASSDSMEDTQESDDNGSDRPTASHGPRKKKKKFSYDENMILVQGVVQGWAKLFGSLAKVTPLSQKTNMWHNICTKVNAISCHRRDIVSCKRRLDDIKRFARRKMEDFKKYSSSNRGGLTKAPKLQDYHRLLLTVLRFKDGRDSITGADVEAACMLAQGRPPPRRPPKMEAPPQEQESLGLMTDDEEPEDPGNKQTGKSSPATLQAADVVKAEGSVSEAAVNDPSAPPADVSGPGRQLDQVQQLLSLAQVMQGNMAGCQDEYHQEKLSLLRQQVDLSCQRLEVSWQQVDLDRQQVDLTRQQADFNRQHVDFARQQLEISRQHLEVRRQHVELMQQQLLEMRRIRLALSQGGVARRHRGRRQYPSPAPAAEATQPDAAQ